MGQGGSNSLWDALTAGLSQQQPPAPPSPEPPAVDQGAWKPSVEQAKISDSLGTVHDLGLSQEGVPISTQSGPYDNAFPNKQNMPASKAWINTYRDK